MFSNKSLLIELYGIEIYTGESRRMRDHLLIELYGIEIRLCSRRTL